MMSTASTKAQQLILLKNATSGLLKISNNLNYPPQSEFLSIYKTMKGRSQTLIAVC
jgi:hypothetical protein